jgi:GntR family transcriptional regulator of gluconate operon
VTNIENERPEVGKKVLAQLRRDIVLYNYKNGEQIKELELAEKYDCSRAAIRGAVVVLQKEGLIKIHKNGTKTVECLSRQDIEDLYELREYIEISAVKRIMKNKIKDFAGIFDIVNSVYSDVKDTVSQLDIDIAFHTEIIRASGNKALLQAWSNISSVIREICSLNLTDSEYESFFKGNFEDRHISLMRALLDVEDNGEAVEKFRQHIAEAYESTVKALENLKR